MIVTAIQVFLVGLRWGFDVTVVAVLIPLCNAILPSLVYCGVAKLIRRDLRPPVQWAAHSIGPILIVALMFLYPSAIDSMIIVLFTAYAVAILFLMRSGSDSLYLASFENVGSAYRTIVFAAFSLLLYAALDLFVYLEITNASQHTAMQLISIGNVLLLIILAIAAANNAHSPTPLKSDSPASEGQKSANISQELVIQTEDQEKIIADIEELLLSKKLYRDVDLNLDRLARRLGIPGRHVSISINQRRSKNVSQFVNEFRVAEACSLLRATDKPVTDIMFDVGFQTKSNFNREFRRVTGFTPIQWRNADEKRVQDKSGNLVQLLHENPEPAKG
ncbi:MAG: AraC family transcriptional regulator [Paracoccaceae bacterium]